jgi:ATP synthase F1 delta subunit
MVSRRRLAKYIAAELLKNNNSSWLFKQVAAYLMTNKAVGQADLLVHDVLDVFARDYSKVSAEVASARSLSAELKQQIQNFVREQTQATTVTLSESVDEALIGGVIISTPNAQYDASVRTKLKQLKL